jgi:hypothetical protein
MNRMEIVVPRASWSDVFSDDVENALIPGAWCLMRPVRGRPQRTFLAPLYCPKNGGKFRSPDAESSSLIPRLKRYVSFAKEVKL